MPVYVAIDPDEAEVSADVADLVPEIVDLAGTRFGPYLFSSTGAVVDHLPGLDYALESQTKPYFAEAPDEALLVHELAHQWFGNSVTPRHWKDVWLSEGLATYAEWLWEEKRGGRNADGIFEDFYDGTDAESEGIWAFPPADPPTGDQFADGGGDVQAVGPPPEGEPGYLPPMSCGHGGGPPSETTVRGDPSGPVQRHVRE